jgi:hypothetical protein
LALGLCGIACADWRSAPVVPKLDAATRSRTIATLVTGRRLGNRADVFAKLGDSISQSAFFLEGLGCARWTPGKHRALSVTIRYFARRRLAGASSECDVVNSFSRNSAATLAFTPASWALEAGGSADPSCHSGETPLACEIRIDRPAYALLLFGTNDVTIGTGTTVHTLPQFMASMRAIVAGARRLGVVPILSTIPPRGGDATSESWTERFNAALVRLAGARRVPIINLWTALQGLPNHGLSPDLLHPSVFGSPCEGLCDPQSCEPGCQAANFTSAGLAYGYDVRNLISLRTLGRLRGIAAEALGRGGLSARRHRGIAMRSVNGYVCCPWGAEPRQLGASP